ncbi:hypothetical protein OG552_08365 [Streptomyces sp. NBC_01476]|uniref:hypothetical protein n=1 Tax=Streptomyces sp. NBC_01476 TaxID=2903881 RepID=UPI002E343516|nr:hypothetical protein [Streptomyces sp. NBC_01476]
MEEIRPRLRALRAALFAALCVTLSSTSHVLMAHAPLPLTVVGGAFAAVFALAYLLGGRKRGFWSIAALMVPLELTVDTLFTSGRQSCYGPSGGPVTGSWRSFHEVVLCHGGEVGGGLASVPGGAAAAQQVPSVALPWLLLALHVTVGLLAAWWLGRGEAALHRVLGAMATAAFRPLLFAAAAARAAVAPLPRRISPAAGRAAAGPLAARPLLHAVVRRGPPVLVAL